jgi:general L-amino acid transport system permease protein
LKRLNAILFFGIFPLIAFVLLTGGNLDLQRFLIGRLVPFDLLFSQSFLGLRVSFWVDHVLSAALLMGITAFAGRLLGGDARAMANSALSFFLLLALVLLAFDLDFGLVPVETRAWGGLLVTLVVAVTGIVVSLPLGILLALGRRSELPAIKVFSVVFIEFWRGVPLITVLVFATYMLPLFLPGGLSVDGLLRALIGVTLFAAAYMAEVVRGGLQAIPRGQYEGAAALGLSYWQTMGQVVLPQALTLVIPGIVNTFIGLFKDTTLVLIVAIFDLLGQLRASFTDPNWSTSTTLFTGFAFGAIVYFIFCFSMSRYSQFVERRLSAGKRH